VQVKRQPHEVTQVCGSPETKGPTSTRCRAPVQDDETVATTALGSSAGGVRDVRVGAGGDGGRDDEEADEDADEQEADEELGPESTRGALAMSRSSSRNCRASGCSSRFIAQPIRPPDRATMDRRDPGSKPE